MNVVKRIILLILLKSRPELRLLLRVSVCLLSRYLGSAQQLSSFCHQFVVASSLLSLLTSAGSTWKMSLCLKKKECGRGVWEGLGVRGRGGGAGVM